MPIKTVATASTLAICVILCLTLSLFSSFAHQIARESVEIAHPYGIHWMVMVITCKYHYPAHKPPPLFCPMLACTKVGGGGVIAGFYGTNFMMMIWDIWPYGANLMVSALFASILLPCVHAQGVKQSVLSVVIMKIARLPHLGIWATHKYDEPVKISNKLASL